MEGRQFGRRKQLAKKCYAPPVRKGGVWGHAPSGVEGQSPPKGSGALAPKGAKRPIL